MTLNDVINEFYELERLGIIYKLDEPNNILYLVIPRDLCKDNVKDNIDRIKSYGIRVFSKIKGLNEYYNVFGDRLERNKGLTESKMLEYAREFIADAAIESKDTLLCNQNAVAYRKLASRATNEEMAEIQEHIKLLNILKGIL